MMDEGKWNVLRGREEVEKNRRWLNEVVKRMDRFVQSEAKSLKDLFRPEMECLRVRLKEVAMKLLEIDPLRWGGKALELHWRKGFYEPLNAAKRLGSRKGLSLQENALIQSLIWSGMGHYHDLILRLGRETGADFVFSPRAEFLYEGKTSFPGENDGGLEEWLRTAFYKSLLYLGDLSRYLGDFSLGKGLDLSKRYYHQALLASDYKAGMPFNQLGRMSEKENHGLNSAYLYLRSLTSEDVFEGAEINLKNLLSKKSKQFHDGVETDRDVREKFILAMLNWTKAFLFDNESSDLSAVCQRVLHIFHDLVEVGFDSQVGVNVVSLVLAVIQRLEMKGEKSRVSMARASLLALFSSCVFKLLKDLGYELRGLDASSMTNVDEPIQNKEQDISYDRPKKRNNFFNRFRRRRNVCASSSDEEYSDDEEDMDSFLSDDDDEDLFGFMSGDSVSYEDSSSDDESNDIVIQESSIVLSTLDLVKVVESHYLTPCVRLLCLWVMSSPDIVKEAEQPAKILWDRLDTIFEMIDIDCPKYTHSDLVESQFKKIDHKTVLFEDFYVRGLKMFSFYHESLNWNGGCISLTEVQLGILRIKQFFKFRNWLQAVRKTPSYSETSEISKSGRESDENKKNALMQNMAQLWLQQEVRNLEGKECTAYSPYVVVDHIAIVKNLRLVKEIVSSRKFAVIIPNAVVQELDVMKKGTNGARNAIRWLERQFKQGNCWLRAQKKHESKPIDEVKVPRRKNKESWHYFQIIECCHYFSTLNNAPAVTLLSSDGITTQEFDPYELTKLIGVRIENIKDFFLTIKRRKKNHLKS